MSGTYKLWELASTRDEVNDMAQQVAESWEGRNQATETEWNEEAVALAYAVHQVLWSRATDDVSHPPYTHVVKGTYIIDALRKAVPKVDRLYPNRNKLDLVVRSIYAALSAAQLVIRVGPRSGGHTFYMRAWPKGFHLEWASYLKSRYIPLKDRPDLDRQDKKAEQLRGPVITYIDFRTIPTPDPTPESVMAYLNQIMPLMAKLQDENNELRRQLNGKQWQEVTELIEAAK